jgi:hypothetical protein
MIPRKGVNAPASHGAAGAASHPLPLNICQTYETTPIIFEMAEQPARFFPSAARVEGIVK